MGAVNVDDLKKDFQSSFHRAEEGVNQKRIRDRLHFQSSFHREVLKKGWAIKQGINLSILFSSS